MDPAGSATIFFRLSTAVVAAPVRDRASASRSPRTLGQITQTDRRAARASRPFGPAVASTQNGAASTSARYSGVSRSVTLRQRAGNGRSIEGLQLRQGGMRCAMGRPPVCGWPRMAAPATTAQGPRRAGCELLGRSLPWPSAAGWLNPRNDRSRQRSPGRARRGSGGGRPRGAAAGARTGAGGAGAQAAAGRRVRGGGPGPGRKPRPAPSPAPWRPPSWPAGAARPR